jgi:hypothetical protein
MAGTDFGGAVSDLFGAFGDFQAASAYGKEAQVAGENATIAAASTKIQEAETARQVTLATGTEEAQTASAGFSNSGSAGDLMRSSLEQGALNKALVANQGAITVRGYQEQQQAAKGQEQAQQVKGAGGIIGGVLGLFGL